MTKYSDKVRRYLAWRYGITDGGEDYMTTKDWLNRGWALDREITALESAKRRAYDRCVSGVASVSGAPGGGGASDGGMSR